MISLDVCSAFIHAKETAQKVYMRAPREWEMMNHVTSGSYSWRLVGNLYGRRTAPAAFRQLWEAILMKAGFRRGTIEPCAYFHDAWKVLATHHIDDARLGGPEQGLQNTVNHLKALTTTLAETGYGADGKPLPAAVVTPGVERVYTEHDEELLNATQTAQYRSAVGSL
eukprot:3155312-Amphidinium_carterae.1